MKTTYLIELCVDEEWFKAIDKFTADVHEGEVCEWIRVDAQTEGEYEDLTNDDENEIIKETHLEETK
jgi:hypothetical protein